MSNHSKCYYHENRDAVGHCENCGRLICEECKLIYRVYHSGGRYHHSYSEKYEYCPICKYGKEDRSSWGVTIFLLIFIGIFISFPLSFGMLQFAPMFSLLFLAIPILMGIYTIYRVFVVQPKIRANAIQKRAEFMQEVGLDEHYNKNSSGIRSEIQYNAKSRETKPYFESVVPKNQFYCAQCGTLLEKTAKFCINCGDSTDDELKMLAAQKE